MPLPVPITAPVTLLLPERSLLPFKIDPITRAGPAIMSAAPITHGDRGTGPAAIPACGSPAITFWLRDNRAVMSCSRVAVRRAHMRGISLAQDFCNSAANRLVELAEQQNEGSAYEKQIHHHRIVDLRIGICRGFAHERRHRDRERLRRPGGQSVCAPATTAGLLRSSSARWRRRLSELRLFRAAVSLRCGPPFRRSTRFSPFSSLAVTRP